MAIVFRHRAWEIGVAHFWSLCVEEQFYLVWPLIICGMTKRRTVLRFSGFAIVFTLVLRWTLLLRSGRRGKRPLPLRIDAYPL